MSPAGSLATRGFLTRNAARLVALAVMFGCYAATRLPELGTAERSALANRFAFTSHALHELPGAPKRALRDVNPALARHVGWISAVGAAVALADLDADGLANDVCHIDPRNDRVTLAPLPGTGERYAMVTLDVVGLPYDARTMAPMGCVPGDFNEDGRLDLFVYYWGRTPVLFLDRQERPGPPSAERYVARELTPSRERWYTNAATVADLDGDGHLDLVIGNYFQDGARILDASATDDDYMQRSMSRAYNGGRNRLFRWRSAATGAEPHASYDEVEGTFDRDSLHAWTLAIGAADMDGDLLPELYFANDFGPDRLYHNRSEPGHFRFEVLEGERKLTTPRSKVLGKDSFKGMGVDFADVNGDGRLDIFVSNIAAEYALLESHFLFVHSGDEGAMQEGRAPFEELSEPLGVSRSSWGWDTRFGDFDNDGVPEALQATGFAKGKTNRWPELQELATGNDELLQLPGSWPRFEAGDDLSGHAPNPFYVQSEDGRYHDLAGDLGVGGEFVTRGIATADIDGDGDLDFAIANQWEPSYLFRNEAPGDRPFLGLHLMLPVGDDGALKLFAGHPTADTRARSAVGASATVHRGDGRVLVGQVDGGNGHSGVRSPGLHFGLHIGLQSGLAGGAATSDTAHGAQGNADAPVAVEVRYRDREGRPNTLSLALTPGWHTVVLPDTAADSQWAALEIER